MLNKTKDISFYYFIACTSFVLGLFMQDFFKIPITGGIIILGLSWIFTFAYKEKFQALLKQPAAIAFIALYFLHLLSMIYTENHAEGWNDLRLKITLFLLPMFMMSTRVVSSNQRFYLLKFFAVLMMLMAGADLTLSISEYLVSSNSDEFYYVHLAHILASKPHYVAWYYSFAIFIVLHQILTGKKSRYLWMVGFVLLLISLALLSSRAYLMAFIIVFSISCVKWAKTNVISKSGWGKILFAFSMFIGAIFLIPKTNSRINDTIVELKELLWSDTHNQTNPRIALWRCGAKIIADQPVFGYGVGDAKEALNRVLEESDFKMWDGQRNVPISEKNFNFHNQYLQTWAEVGVLGFLLLIFLMIRPFFLKNQHPLFLIFIGLTIIGFLTESMLERQAGVLFIAFMYPLLSGLKIKQDHL
ncbi:MAG: O-antigen ligase family protein [Flavobacteriales bacterium]|nr:O-antigen ligase family protein [Flavobacteriales bacterium]